MFRKFSIVLLLSILLVLSLPQEMRGTVHGGGGFPLELTGECHLVLLLFSTYFVCFVPKPLLLTLEVKMFSQFHSVKK